MARISSSLFMALLLKYDYGYAGLDSRRPDRVCGWRQLPVAGSCQIKSHCSNSTNLGMYLQPALRFEKRIGRLRLLPAPYQLYASEGTVSHPRHYLGPRLAE
jgi:hypothetical protein